MATGTPTPPQGAPRASRRALITGGAIVVGLAVIAGIGIDLSNPAPATIPSGDLFTVRMASNQATMAARGTVQSQSKIPLSFLASNTINMMAVKVGSHVKAGEVLATLVSGAQQAELSQAEAALGVAKGQLAQAIAATSSVGVAQSQVQQATAGSAAAVDRGQLEQAEAALTQLKQGPTAASIAAANAQVTQAQTALSSAEANATQAQNAYNDRTTQEAQVVAAQNAVAQTHAALLTAEQNQTSQHTSAEQAITTAQNNLATAQQNLATDQTEYGAITLTQVQQADQTYLAELGFYQSWQTSGRGGVNPYAGPMAADQTSYQALSQGYYALQQAGQTVKADQTALSQAQAGLTTVNTSVTQAQTAYTAAEKSLQQAQAEYNDRVPQEQALVAAQNAVTQAKSGLAAAQANAKSATQPATPAEISKAEAAVATAQAALTTAIQTNGADVQAAKSGVNEASQTTAAAVQAAKAGVPEAESEVQAAEVALSNTVLKAPVAGTIVQSPDYVGASVQAGAPVFTLDVQQLQIAIVVSEAQLNAIQLNDPIRLQVPELPGKTFSGSIFQVYPTPIPNNTGEYKVLATINDPVGINPGMTGTVTIHLGSHARALLVPTTAVHQVNGTSGVYVLTKPEAGTVPVSALRFVPVVLGPQDPQYVEVLKGIRPGMVIALGEGKFFFS